MTDDPQDPWKLYLKQVKVLSVPKKIEKKPKKVRVRHQHPLKDFLTQIPLENVSRETFSATKQAHLLSRKKTRNATIERKIDLHGLTLKEAYQELSVFLWKASQQGLRTVLIVTGKGRRSQLSPQEEKPRLNLKEAVPLWLQDVPLRTLVGSWAKAPQDQGGEGALYVFLRANPLD